MYRSLMFLNVKPFAVTAKAGHIEFCGGSKESGMVLHEGLGNDVTEVKFVIKCLVIDKVKQ